VFGERVPGAKARTYLRGKCKGKCKGKRKGKRKGNGKGKGKGKCKGKGKGKGKGKCKGKCQYRGPSLRSRMTRVWVGLTESENGSEDENENGSRGGVVRG
jgi:hypothetical protein